jgi:hypothetical protein
MEEQNRLDKIDPPANSSAPDNPLTDNNPDLAPSPSRSSGESEGKATLRAEPSGHTSGLTPPEIGLLSGESPSRTKRLSEAFWEGVSSAKPGVVSPKPGNEKQAPARGAPPSPKNRPSSGPPALMDWLIQSGKSAAAAIGDSVSNLPDSVAKLAKKKPSFPTKWGEAFREGTAKVRRNGVKPIAETIPPPAGSPTAVGKGIWDSMSQIGDSAAEFVRDALVTFIPGGAGEIEKKIRLGEKKIRDLYVEIGREAVGSWSSGGPVETEKVLSLMDEFRKQEDIIQKLKVSIPKIAPVKKAGANGSPPKVPEARVNPESVQEEPRTEMEVLAAPTIQEVIPPEVEISAPTAEKPIEPGDRQEPGRPADEMILSPTPGAESLTASPTAEEAVDAGPAVQEEADTGADQALSEEPEGVPEKTEGVLEKR